MSDLVFSEQGFLRCLVSHLLAEVREVGVKDVEVLEQQASDLLGDLIAGRIEWKHALRQYNEVKRAFGAYLAETSEVADCYTSMEVFWDEARNQASGQSAGTFWDTFEHGLRRQLEYIFAEAYGSASAVLVNSGMSAVHVAISSAGLTAGDVVLAHSRAYFETTDLLENVYEPAGVRIERADFADRDAIRRSIREHNPKVVLAETALNAPEPVVPDFDALEPQDLCRRYVIDNSVLSHAVKFDAIKRMVPANDVLVVESGIKYATHECSAGVVYGDGTAIEKAREYARRTGQFLQSKAFHFIRPGEIRTLQERLQIHSSRNRAFVKRLSSLGVGLVNIDTAAARQGSVSAEVLRDCGPGTLVFLMHEGLNSKQYQHIVDELSYRCRKEGLSFDIRAGFGWDNITGRSYTSTFLNQPDAPSFIRFSIGIMPENEVMAVADHAAKIINDLINTQAGPVGKTR